tara:strand:- start:284 stop:445 length:162 start_codon:yes stop_codon:yes gene_type:complete
MTEIAALRPSVSLERNLMSYCSLKETTLKLSQIEGSYVVMLAPLQEPTHVIHI